MSLFLVLVDPTPADLTLAGRIAGARSVGQPVEVTPIVRSSSGPLVDSHAAQMGLRFDIDRTVRRPPRPRKTKVIRRKDIS